MGYHGGLQSAVTTLSYSLCTKTTSCKRLPARGSAFCKPPRELEDALRRLSTSACYDGGGKEVVNPCYAIWGGVRVAGWDCKRSNRLTWLDFEKVKTDSLLQNHSFAVVGRISDPLYRIASLSWRSIRVAKSKRLVQGWHFDKRLLQKLFSPTWKRFIYNEAGL